MDKSILLFLLPLVFIGCAKSGDGPDEDPMEVWNELADELKARPELSDETGTFVVGLPCEG